MWQLDDVSSKNAPASPPVLWRPMRRRAAMQDSRIYPAWCVFRHLEGRFMGWWAMSQRRLCEAFLATGRRERVQVAWAAALILLTLVYVVGRLAQAIAKGWV